MKKFRKEWFEKDFEDEMIIELMGEIKKVFGATDISPIEAQYIWDSYSKGMCAGWIDPNERNVKEVFEDWFQD